MSWPADAAPPGRLPIPIAATRLLDLEDGEFERPAENSGRGGVTCTLK